MARITITIEDDEPKNANGSYKRTETASVVTGPSSWTDHKFFLIAANRAVVRLSEKIHLEKEEKRDDLGEIQEDPTPFSVYYGGGFEEFPTEADAKAWADKMHGLHGGTFECRDENFDHVFTVED